MAEAVAAVGLVASVIQIVDFSQRFLRRLKEYQEKTNRLPVTFQAIQLQLPLILNGLKIVEVRAERKELPDELFHLIQPMLESCRKEIENLDKIFTHLSQPSSISSLSKASRAMKALRFDHDVQQSVAILKNHIEVLTWHQINSASVHTSRLLIQGISHGADDPQSPVEESCENAPSVIVAPFQESDDNANMWERYLRLDRCTCARAPNIQKSAELSLWPVSFSSQVLSVHVPGCYYFLERENIWKLSFSLNCASLLLKNRLRFAMSVQFGYGRIAIDPKLELRGTRRSDSPVFALLSRLIGLPKESQSTRVVGELGTQIRRIFENGEASPFEVDSHDRTLIHATYHMCHQLTDEKFHQKLEVLKMLHGFGVPTNEQCNSTYNNCFGDLGNNENGLASEHFLAFIKCLIDIGAEHDVGDTIDMSAAGMKSLIELMRMFPDIAESFNCNVLQFALLRRSISVVKKLIKRPGLVAQRNALGQNSLHLASDWPEATQLLLSSGAPSFHSTDNSGLPPLAYAIVFKGVETVKLLLASDCPLSLEGPRIPSGPLEICEQHFCRDIFEVVASNLVQRRLRLLDTARQLIPETTLMEMIPHEEDVPDASSVRLIKAINKAACGFTERMREYNKDPSSYYSQRINASEYTSVYRAWTGPVEGAEILFNAGFRSILGKDESGRNPLQSRWPFLDVGMVGWLYKKGLHLTKIEDFVVFDDVPNTNPDLHWLILRGTRSIIAAIEPWHYPGRQDAIKGPFREDVTEALEITLNGELAQCVDRCSCPCSPGGCNSVAIFLKEVAQLELNWVPSNHSDWLFLLLRFSQCVLAILNGSSSWDQMGTMAQSFVRFTLFEVLNVQHVCCTTLGPYDLGRWNDGFKPRFSEDEIDFILEENCTLIEKFETLLPLAQSGWESTSKPWTRFWRDFYLDNIAMDTNDLDDVNNRYLETVTALGVKIEGDREVGHECSWICYFEQPAEDNDVEKRDERLSDNNLVERNEKERERYVPTGEPFKLKSKTPPKFVCPFFEQRQKRGYIIPF